ncbi:MAG: methyltransferase [Fimbriimonadaceae bacterium]|nr:methyltransferase [Fimbriimonadaceae bacterium]
MTPDHYFTDDPNSPSERRTLTFKLRGELWQFITDRGVFSADRLDPGSRLLIEALALPVGAAVLEVGGGYGPIGLVAARLVGPTGHVTLVEVNRRAAALAVENAALNGLDNVTVVCADATTAELPAVDWVLTNPPMRAGWQVVVPLLERSAAVLRPGGEYWLVGFKYLGVETLQKHLARLVGPSRVIDRGSGYRVLAATREAADG